MSKAGTVSAKVKKDILNALAELGGETYKDEDVVFEGNRVVLPQGSTTRQMIAFLEAKQKEDEEISQIHRVFPYRPWDGAVAMWEALREHFGSVIHQAQTVSGMFGKVKIPPQLIEVPTGHDQTTQVPWGEMTIPLLDDVIFTTGHVRTPEDGLLFQITAEGPKRERWRINGIFQLIQDQLEKNSIYRGKAFDGQEMPKFLDLSGVSREKIVYSAETMTQLDASVFAPIRYPGQLEANGVPIKRAVLLEGAYGTGKTSTAFLIAQEATEHGWTFIYARPGRDDLAEVFRTARLYQKAVVFFEDLDTIADPGGKQDSITSLLDTFDGFETKGTEILAVLSTNHPERIHKGMLRPGRLDATIELTSPDKAAIAKIIQNNVPSRLLDKNIDWDAVGESMEDYLPAFVTESASRAIRYALVRTNGEMENVTLETEDFVSAANGLRPQWDRMQGAPEATPKDKLTESLIDVAIEAARRQHILHGDMAYAEELES